MEATGVAESDALVYEVEENLPQVRLDSVISIVDAYASIAHPLVGYVTRTQLQQADVILINKVDLVEPEKIEEVVAQARQYNDSAVILKSVRCNVDPKVLFGVDVRHREFPSPPHAGQKFESFTFTTENELDRGKFERLVSNLPREIYRAKGFVRLDKTAYLFNYVAGRVDLEEFRSADTTQLVFIGSQLDASQKLILDQLRNCEV